MSTEHVTPAAVRQIALAVVRGKGRRGESASEVEVERVLDWVNEILFKDALVELLVEGRVDLYPKGDPEDWRWFPRDKD